MSLAQIWKDSPAQLQGKHVQQIIAFAGDGRLRDGSEASAEFRGFLTQISSGHLARYADECLTTRFDDNGFALQDTVNEIGRRLGFAVQDGRYRGSSQSIGFDGLWHSSTGHAIVVEVKTTDAYRIDLDTIANYRRELIHDHTIQEENSSVLIVVGRQDTGDLEAQTRGSRHAWDIRLISVDSLLRLVAVKEEIEDPHTVRQISDLLSPQEYTRVDGIIDLVFATALDVLEDEQKEGLGVDDGAEPHQPKFIPVGFNQACVDRIKKHLSLELLRRSKATFSTPDAHAVVICSVSKTHGDPGSEQYWFAFHPHQAETLSSASVAYVAYGCGSPATVLVIPFTDFRAWLDGLNMTKLPDREYWHVHIFRDGDRFVLHRRSGVERIDLTRYLLPPST